MRKNSRVTTSIQLELLANRKTVLGTHHADNEKLGMKETELPAAHAVLDTKRLTPVNRTVVRELYDALYPYESETPATTKLRSFLKTPEDSRVRKTHLRLGVGRPAWQIRAVIMHGRRTSSDTSLRV